ncbi:MAG: hypothetical protein R3E48_14655 [Burkholderiaceae bacterium]
MSASEEHEAFIKTPKQLITVVVLAFVVPVLLIMLLVKFVGSEPKPAARHQRDERRSRRGPDRAGGRVPARRCRGLGGTARR